MEPEATRPGGRVRSADSHNHRKHHMQHLTLTQVADIIESATVEHTADHGHAIVHVGTTEAGLRFVLMNDCNGNSCVSYQL